MIFVFYFLAALLVYLSYKSYRSGTRYLEYFRSELAKQSFSYTPYVTIVVPCRGLDEGFKQNLRAFLEQDYPGYETVFVVDDNSDPAVEVIRKIAGSCPSRKLVIAPKSVESGQKVENLREAVLNASDRSEAFVFADSDARPSATWLRSLVAPLQDRSIGATTGYRWFISVRPNFASELRSAWNASIASALGPDSKMNFCWGGSTGIRRELFETLDIREKWRGTVSDDFTVTRAINQAGLAIKFVPQAIVASVEDCKFNELLEFTTRQMKITRVYAPRLWKSAFIGSGLFTLVMVSALLVIVMGKTNGRNVAAAVVTVVLVTVFSFGKSLLRLKAVQMVLPKYRKALQLQNYTQCTLWLLTPPLFLYNCLVAVFFKRIKWRGITYELASPQETRVIR